MTAYLVDTNVLLRFVKPDDRDYPLVRSAVHQLWASGEDLCYTSQNLAEFWNTCTRPGERNGYGLSIPEADRRARLADETLTYLEDSKAVHLELAGEIGGGAFCFRCESARCETRGGHQVFTRSPLLAHFQHA